MERKGQQKSQPIEKLIDISSHPLGELFKYIEDSRKKFPTPEILVKLKKSRNETSYRIDEFVIRILAPLEKGLDLWQITQLVWGSDPIDNFDLQQNLMDMESGKVLVKMADRRLKLNPKIAEQFK